VVFPVGDDVGKLVGDHFDVSVCFLEEEGAVLVEVQVVGQALFSPDFSDFLQHRGSFRDPSVAGHCKTGEFSVHIRVFGFFLRFLKHLGIVHGEGNAHGFSELALEDGPGHGCLGIGFLVFSIAGVHGRAWPGSFISLGIGAPSLFEILKDLPLRLRLIFLAGPF
jgi:hypothetical protein